MMMMRKWISVNDNDLITNTKQLTVLVYEGWVICKP